MQISFRKFFEEEEKKSPYISALEDELGINSDDLEKEPQIGSFFAFGSGNISNIGPYKIIEFKRNKNGQITHAVVIQNNDSLIKNRQYKDEDGKIFRINGEKENKKFIVSIEELDDLMKGFLSQSSQSGVV